ncbi:MAG: methyltransferase domain-containing protein [Methanomicrobiales archaeon]|nr:methyltransferase domain-containing protein [Methanomicrobiales archaeon]
MNVLPPMEDTKKWYDRISRYYDILAWNSEKPVILAAVRMLDAKPGETILETGYGTGHAAIALADTIGQGKIHGIDISGGMYRIAQAAIEREGLGDRVMLTQGDARSLPYADRSFHAIFMSFTLKLFSGDGMRVVLRECRRVLAPGGRVCIASLEKTQHPGLAERMYEWLHRLFPVYFDCRPIPLAQIMEQAGFRITQGNELHLWGLPVKIVCAVRMTEAESRDEG